MALRSSFMRPVFSMLPPAFVIVLSLTSSVRSSVTLFSRSSEDRSLIFFNLTIGS